jgi:mxaA protein
MRLLLALSFALLMMQPAQAAIDAVNVYEPRGFGYFIGDTIERDVEVVTSGDTELFTAALPRPGALTYWLDLIAIKHSERTEGDKRIYNISLTYQIFYSALEAKRLDIPVLPLKFKNPSIAARDAPASSNPEDAQSRYTASVPAFSLVVSPLRDIVLDDLMPDKQKELADILRPDIAAHPVGVTAKERMVAAAVVALAISGLLLLWYYAIWPFGKRAGRPFTQADRQIRDLMSFGAGTASYREALIILHRAFDEAAGHRVFAEDASSFTATHPRFAGLAPGLASFFESSRLYFFSNDHSAAERRFPFESIRQLAGDLAREERAAA